MVGMATSRKMHSAWRQVSMVPYIRVQCSSGSGAFETRSGELTHEGSTTLLSSTSGISFSDQSD